MTSIENKLEITIHGSDAIHRKVKTENGKTFVEVPKEWSDGKVAVILYV